MTAVLADGQWHWRPDVICDGMGAIPVEIAWRECEAALGRRAVHERRDVGALAEEARYAIASEVLDRLAMDGRLDQMGDQIRLTGAASAPVHILDLLSATAIEDGDAAKWRPEPGPDEHAPGQIAITAYDGGSAATARAYAEQLTAAGWSAWAHPESGDRPLGRQSRWTVTVTAPEGITGADIPPRHPGTGTRRTDEQIVDDEIRERYELLVAGAQDLAERSANVRMIRRALAEAEAGGSGREVAVLQGVLALAEDDGSDEVGTDGEDDDAQLAEADAALQAVIAARGAGQPSDERPPASLSEEEQLYAAHVQIHQGRGTPRRAPSSAGSVPEQHEAAARGDRVAATAVPLGDPEEGEEDGHEDDRLAQANKTLQSVIAAHRAPEPSDERPAASTTEEEQLYAAHVRIPGAARR
jgi:hypothetical protein